MENLLPNGRIVDPQGVTRYYKDGLLHREDGPAVIGYSGIQYWLINDNLHREDGPAVMYPSDFIEMDEYHINDKRISEQEFMIWKMKNLME